MAMTFKAFLIIISIAILISIVLLGIPGSLNPKDIPAWVKGAIIGFVLWIPYWIGRFTEW